MSGSDGRGKVNLKFLVIAALCGLTAVGGFIYILLSGISGLTDQLIQADMPGSQTLKLTETGTYTVFHEWTHPYTSTVEVGGDGDAQALKLTLVDSQGKEIPVTRSEGNSTYQMGSREGYSIAGFTIVTPGEYTLAGSYGDGSQVRLMLTVANNFMGKILKIIGLCFVVLGVPGVLSMVFLVFALKPLMGSSRSEG